MDEQAPQVAAALLRWIIVSGLLLFVYLAVIAGAPRVRRRRRRRR